MFKPYIILLVLYFGMASASESENRVLVNMLNNAFTISNEPIEAYQCNQIGVANPCPKVLESIASESNRKHLVDHIKLKGIVGKEGTIGACSQVQLSQYTKMNTENLEASFKRDPYLTADHTLIEISPSCFSETKMEKLGFKDKESGFKYVSASYQYYQKKLEQGLIQAVSGLASLEAHDFNFRGVLNDIKCEQLADNEAGTLCEEFKGCAPSNEEKQQKFDNHVSLTIDVLLEEEYYRRLRSNLLTEGKAGTPEFSDVNKKLTAFKEQYPWTQGREFENYKYQIHSSEGFKKLMNMRMKGKVNPSDVRADEIKSLTALTGLALKKQFKVSAELTKLRIAEFQRAMMCLQGNNNNCKDFQDILKRAPEIQYNVPELNPQTDEEKAIVKDYLVKKAVLEQHQCVDKLNELQASDAALMRDTFLGVSLLALPVGRMAMGLRGAQLGARGAQVLKVSDPLMLGTDVAYTGVEAAAAYKACKEESQKVIFEPMQAGPVCQMLGAGMSTAQSQYQQCLVQSAFVGLGALGVMASLKAIKTTPRGPSGKVSSKSPDQARSTFTLQEVKNFNLHVKETQRLKQLATDFATASPADKAIMKAEMMALKESIDMRKMDPNFRERLQAYADMRRGNDPKVQKTKEQEADLDEFNRIKEASARKSEAAAKLKAEKEAIRKEYSTEPDTFGYFSWVGKDKRRSFAPSEKLTVYLDLDPKKMGENYGIVIEQISELLRKNGIPHNVVGTKKANEIMQDRFFRGKSLAFNPTEVERDELLKEIEQILSHNKAKISDHVSTDLQRIGDSHYLYTKKPVQLKKSDDPKELFNHNSSGWVTDARGVPVRYKGELISVSKVQEAMEQDPDLYLELFSRDALK